MGTLTLDRQPQQLLSQYNNFQWNSNDPVEAKGIGSALPKRQSHNPFFIRNNPHPSRVRHIKGLLGHPVCAVLDAGYREGTSSILVHKAPTLRKKEAFVPGVGLVTIQPAWVEQLQSLTKKLGVVRANIVAKQQKQTETKCSRPATRQASRPSTRHASRQSSRAGSKPRLLEKRHMEEEFVRKTCSREADVKVEDAFTRKTNSRDGKEVIAELPTNNWVDFLQGTMGLNESEASVAELLAQILKTDSLDVIKHWLMEAPEKEKEVVLDMIRAASSSNLEFREVMNKLIKNNPGDDVETLRNEYEKMLDMKDITDGKKSSVSNSPPRLSSREDCHMLDVIKENIEADMVNSSRLGSRSQKAKSTDIILPPLKREDEEIEVLRSQLASRSNVNVFSAKSGSRRSTK